MIGKKRIAAVTKDVNPHPNRSSTLTILPLFCNHSAAMSLKMEFTVTSMAAKGIMAASNAWSEPDIQGSDTTTVPSRLRAVLQTMIGAHC